MLQFVPHSFHCPKLFLKLLFYILVGVLVRFITGDFYIFNFGRVLLWFFGFIITGDFDGTTLWS